MAKKTALVQRIAESKAASKVVRTSAMQAKSALNGRDPNDPNEQLARDMMKYAYNPSQVSQGQTSEIPLYDPQFSEDFLQIPWDMQIRRAWYFHYYQFNEIIGRCVDVLVSLIASPIRLIPPNGSDPEKNKYVLEFFQEMAERIELQQVSHEIAFEVIVQGNCFIYQEEDYETLEYLDFKRPEVFKSLAEKQQWYDSKVFGRLNPRYSGWKRLRVLPTAQCQVITHEFSDDIEIKYVSSAQIPTAGFVTTPLSMMTNIVVNKRRESVPTDLAADDPYEEEDEDHALKGSATYGGRTLKTNPYKGSCFPAGTLILTDKGVKDISVIECGDKVLTHNGRFCTVIDNSVRIVDDGLIEIKISGLPETDVTPEHPYAVVQNGENIWVEAQNLEIGDWIVITPETQDIRDLKEIDISEKLSKDWSVEHIGENRARYIKDYIYERPKKIHRESWEKFGVWLENLPEPVTLYSSDKSPFGFPSWDYFRDAVVYRYVKDQELKIEQNYGEIRFYPGCKKLSDSYVRTAEIEGLRKLEIDDNLLQSVAHWINPKVVPGTYNLGIRKCGYKSYLQYEVTKWLQKYFKFDTEKQIYGSGCSVDIVDFDSKIIIEVDGERWHQDSEKDENRDEKLKELGYEIIRVSENAWVKNRVETQEKLFKELSGRMSPADFSHKETFKKQSIEVIQLWWKNEVDYGLPEFVWNLSSSQIKILLEKVFEKGLVSSFGKNDPLIYLAQRAGIKLIYSAKSQTLGYPMGANNNEVIENDYSKAYRVKSLKRQQAEVPVYNMSVDEDHSFIANGAVVHNCCHHIARRKSGYMDYGISLMDRVLRSAIYLDKLRQIQTITADRRRTPLRIIFAPEVDEVTLMGLERDVDLALVNPDYSIITNYEINWQEFGVQERFIDLSGEYTEYKERIMIAFGLPMTLLTGEGLYSGQQASISVLLAEINLVRNEIINRFIQDALFKPVAVKKAFYEVNKYGREKLLYPRVRLKQTPLEDKTAKVDQLYNMASAGRLSFDYVLEELDIDPVENQQKMANEKFTVKDSEFTGLMSAMYQSIASELVERSDIVQKVSEEIGITLEEGKEGSADDEGF